MDRDEESGCCNDGWTPGTQPLARMVQNYEGVYPVLYIYGQLSCGWRNGTYGQGGNKPTNVSAKCDYGTCYIVPQNFTCGDSEPPLLNGCCRSKDYGPHCRRGYYFEDINDQIVNLLFSMVAVGVKIMVHIVEGDTTSR